MRAAVFLTLTVLLTAHTGGNKISLTTEKSVMAERGQNVNLTCSIDQNVTVVDFSWTNGKETLCVYKKTIKNIVSGFSCSYTDDQSLLLNIQQVELTHNGEYICMLVAKKGHGSIKTNLHVSEINVATARTNMAEHPQAYGSASETEWISFLVILTTLLSLVLDSGI